jgi:hypothetical protein
MLVLETAIDLGVQIRLRRNGHDRIVVSLTHSVKRRTGNRAPPVRAA